MKKREAIKVTPIGYVRSGFKMQEGTPIQPSFAKKVKGEVVVKPEYLDALLDIDGFERIWVIYLFHRAGPFKHQVTPYRDTVKHGLFATRAPSRPNPVGMSVVKLLRVDQNILYVSGVDILDGTPVLDIKPYVADFDAYPGSKAGWLDQKNSSRKQADKRFER